jgi:hypothetical protein
MESGYAQALREFGFRGCYKGLDLARSY